MSESHASPASKAPTESCTRSRVAAPPEPRRISNLRLRWITAVLVIPPVIYTFMAGGLLYLLVVTGVTLLGVREFYFLIEEKGAHPLKGFGLAAGAALPIVAWFGNEYHATVLMAAVLLAVMVAQGGKAQITEALASIAGTFFGVFYVGWLLSHAIVLRRFHDVVASKWGAGAQDCCRRWRVLHAFHCERRRVVRRGRLLAAAATAGASSPADRPARPSKVRSACSPARLYCIQGHLRSLAARAVPAFRGRQPCSSPRALTPGSSVIRRVVAEARRPCEGHGLATAGHGRHPRPIDSNLFAIPVMYYLLLAYTWVRVG